MAKAQRALGSAHTLLQDNGSDAVKVKGVITGVAVADALQAEVRLYDRLFKDEYPDTVGSAGRKDYQAALNPDSLKVITAYVEPSLASAQPDEKFQFEWRGYFVADRKDHEAGKAVFNKDTGLKDTWANQHF
jgi:glutaminyl-tRNA synthetase